MNKDIEHAIANLRSNAARYAKSERYYNGDHDLAFATEKFQNTFGTLFREFALNLCPVICDAVRDKLRVVGFSADSFGVAELQSYRVGAAANSETSATSVTSVTSVTSLNSATRQIWQRNRMGTRSGEVHKEALKCGDAYMFIWPNSRGEAVFYPNKAANVTVAIDDSSPGSILWAAKAWAVEKHIRLNIYHADRIEKYISRSESQGELPDPKDFIEFGIRNAERGITDGTPTITNPHSALRIPQSVVPNPYGVVPVFHFANNADLGAGGRSELEAAMPVQDGLNKSVLDMLVAMEFSAFRQRWAAGIEIEFDDNGKPIPPFKAGVEHIWLSENPNARFGDFEASKLDQFLKVKDSFRIDMASVTGTPLHYFLQQTGGFPSGESLKKAETRFLAKVRDRQESFGQVWADAMAFALMIEGQGRNISLLTEWEDPAPLAEREFLENILLKKQIGLPVEQALLEAGYGDADVKAMVKGSEREPVTEDTLN